MKRIGFALFGFASVYSLTSDLRADLPPLIPRTVLFGNPDKENPQISPDGKYLAFLAPDDGVLNVWVRTTDKSDDRPVTKDRNRGIRVYFWSPDGEHILYLQDKDGDENWHVFRAALKTTETQDLTPYDGVRAGIVAVEPQVPDEILVAMNKRTPELLDVYRLNIDTGAITLELQNDEGFVGWDADHQLRVRAAIKPTPDGGTTLLVRDRVDEPWRTAVTWSPVDALNSGSIAFTADGTELYLVSSKGSNTSELRKLHLSTGKEERLAFDRHADLAGIFMHPSTYEIQAASFQKERSHWKVLDPDVKEDFSRIRRLHRGDFKPISRDLHDQTWLIAFTEDMGPVSYFAYDRESKEARFLFTNRKALEDLTLARMEPIGFRARDGLLVHGYLTTPPGLNPRNLPMVVNVHGGPWSRDTWGYEPEAQWLANRGYAVLQVNFRGSRGYGKDFLNAGNREWGGKMQDDLTDGVRWATALGIADPERVAIVGASYGGYAALVGLSATPDLFRCGVAICGPSNLITFLSNVPPYWKPLEPILWDRVGHPERDAEFLLSRSPMTFIDRIRRPLLIGQGANDPRVKKSESLQVVEALRSAGKPIEYVEYADEGHGFARPENRLDFYAKAEKFLAEHLGGRYEE